MVAEETNATRPRDVGFTSEEAEVDNFPVGMRVLAVDDDPACLKLLEALLRKCQYHVTTTNQAVKALKMLRKNKHKFDLVISDVQMPDMDGFKLLEHVGLEMDLPVIMLSAYSDTKFVMKGISHGACDYLLKPVRMEELKNIWQHVIRRKKFDTKDQNRSPNPGEAFQGGGEGGQGPELMDNVYLNGKHGRKRKDQNEDEDEENANENEDPSNQKKARVVWSVDLHRKFVAAVNQLGIDKAFPKRILDLMNVEGLTRENVASHLQKYRLYLKRISSVTSQQVNLAADHSYLRMNPLNEFTEFHTLSGSGRLLNASLSSYPHVSRVGRLNAPTNFGSHSHGLTSGLLPSNVRTPCSPINTFGKFHPVVLSGDRNANIFPGVPVSLDLEQLRQNKFLNQIGKSNHIDDQAAFCVVNDMLDTGPGVASSNNSVLGVSKNPLLLQENPQQLTASKGGFVSPHSLKMASLNQETLKTDVSDQINEDLQSTVELSRSINFTSASALSSSFEDSRGDLQCQDGLLGNIVHNVNQFPMARWEEYKQYSCSSTPSFGIFNPLAPAYSVMEPLSQIQIQSQLNGGASSPMQPSLVEEMVTDTKASSNEDYLLEQRSQGGFVKDECESLEDLMAVMIKENRGEAIFMDGQFRVDA